MTAFKRCAFHLDLRIQVLRFPKLLELVDFLFANGFNALIIEWEASFPYAKHATISNQYAYSRDEVRQLVEYAKTRSIEIIPLQQCFGHVEYILRHERYARLREDQWKLSQVCPSKDKEALPVFRELIEDLASLHPGPYFHIGGDETRLLGHCPACAEIVKSEGTSYLYARYLKLILDLVIEAGKIPLLWADIILKYPQFASTLPKEAIFIDWNYGWAFDKFGDNKPLREYGFTLWGAPAIRSNPDNYWLTCWKRHLDNFRDFIPFARQSGYEGIVLTSWSTSGEYDYFRDAENHVADFIPRRRVYPQPGFTLLIQAFCSARSGPDRFDPSSFLVDYANSVFGLSLQDSGRLAGILYRERASLATGPVTDDDAASSRQALDFLRQRQPAKNKTEWDHLVLMAWLEAHQLALICLENTYQADTFSRDQTPHLKTRVDALLLEADSIDKEFTRLNGHYLHPGELDAERRYRRYRLDHLTARLNALSPAPPAPR